jgi:hypothetical protein
MKKKALLLGAALLLLGMAGMTGIASCTSYEVADTPCNEDPSVCSDGQTCWFDESSVKCLKAGSNPDGMHCESLVGVATCADGLGCFKTAGMPEGICRPFCDKGNQGSCADGSPCQRLLLSIDGNDYYFDFCAPSN